MKTLTFKKMGQILASVTVVIVAIVSLSRCGTGSGVTQTFVQIERLGRPAINEGLVLYNNELNAFNSIPPSMDLTTSNPLVAAVLGEASAVLTAIYTFAQGFGAPRPGDVVGGFIPDVMRIDTTNTITPGNMAYNGAAVGTDTGAAGSDPVILTGGRKIEDQVMNITFSYLFAGTAGSNVGTTFETSIAQNNALPYTDRLTYSMGTTCAAAGTGSNLAAPGHSCLFKQSARYGTASFPFLATPN